MEVGHIVFRCGTALDKVKVRVLIDNNQRMLELPAPGAFRRKYGT